MSHEMTQERPTPGPGQSLQMLETSINSGTEAVENYCTEEVLFRSFETNAVDYYSDTAVCYPIPSIRPSRFGPLGFTVEPVGDGYHIEVETSYRDAAPVAPLDDPDDEVPTLGENELREVFVLFDGSASIGYQGCFLDATVVIGRDMNEP